MVQANKADANKAILSTKEIRISAISEVYRAKAQLTLDSIKELYSKNTDWAHMEYRFIMISELLSRKDIDAVVIATP